MSILEKFGTVIIIVVICAAIEAAVDLIVNFDAEWGWRLWVHDGSRTIIGAVMGVLLLWLWA